MQICMQLQCICQTVDYFTLGHPAMITDPCMSSNCEGTHIPNAVQCLVNFERMWEHHHNIGSLMGRAHPSSKTDRDHVVKDNLGRYCPKTFKTAKGKKEMWCHRESKPGLLPGPGGTTFLFSLCCFMSWSQGGTHLRNEMMYPALVAVIVILVCTVLTVNNQEKTVNRFKKMNGQTVDYFTLGHPAMKTDTCMSSNCEGAHIRKVPFKVPLDVCPASTSLEVASVLNYDIRAILNWIGIEMVQL